MNSIVINEDTVTGLAVKSGDYLEIIIQDSGVGMSEDIKERIFEPFFTTKPIEKGTGLGLSVVHGAIKACNGGVHVESKLGEGTTFKIYLPVSDDAVINTQQDVDDSESVSTTLDPKGKLVLFVDDEPGLVDVGLGMLKSIGYEGVGFSDSKEALGEFLKNPEKYVAVITDQVMPGLAGQELASQIRKVRGDIPIFLCTGYSETINEQVAIKEGFKGFFLKPVTLRDLAKALNGVVNLKILT
ncbi:MAG: response regulator [Magnetococcales bacterium]|nr:response regulator [Magnetococcales bacterium]